ncbi:hypothetical protein BZG36_00477 [Bifiguratus adelaidae]|uniref:Uncharacterized protein n=1 Tax=Bifiguratus adelaidae TaxID=1938954 RepID=A0A261Y7C4_9FUNG|nr:hypothetical protein BZG36_00477 [Bifiguratus adelaidae]
MPPRKKARQLIQVGDIPLAKRRLPGNAPLTRETGDLASKDRLVEDLAGAYNIHLRKCIDRELSKLVKKNKELNEESTRESLAALFNKESSTQRTPRGVLVRSDELGMFEPLTSKKAVANMKLDVPAQYREFVKEWFTDMVETATAEMTAEMPDAMVPGKAANRTRTCRSTLGKLFRADLTEEDRKAFQRGVIQTATALSDHLSDLAAQVRAEMLTVVTHGIMVDGQDAKAHDAIDSSRWPKVSEFVPELVQRLLDAGTIEGRIPIVPLHLAWTS